MDADTMLIEYRNANRIRRDHIWFLYPGLRWRFEEIEALEIDGKNDPNYGSQMDCNGLLSGRTKSMGVNRIREILKVASQPGMISLASISPASPAPIKRTFCPSLSLLLRRISPNSLY